MGERIKKAIGIKGDFKSTVLPMMNYSYANIFMGGAGYIINMYFMVLFRWVSHTLPDCPQPVEPLRRFSLIHPSQAAPVAIHYRLAVRAQRYFLALRSGRGYTLLTLLHKLCPERRKGYAGYCGRGRRRPAQPWRGMQA